jgi:hypothetical protein
MVTRRFVALHLAACAAASLFFVVTVAAQDTRTREPNTTGSAVRESPDPPLTVPQAPVGHRQPRAADLPPESRNAGSESGRSQADRDLDKALQICRGC